MLNGELIDLPKMLEAFVVWIWCSGEADLPSLLLQTCLCILLWTYVTQHAKMSTGNAASLQVT
jgi:hypothetical protein